MAKALRIADKAADRIEDQLDGANITQATVAFGVATEKALLLNSDPMMVMQVQHSIEPIDPFAKLAALHAAIVASMKANPSGEPQPTPLLESATTGDPSAQTGQ